MQCAGQRTDLNLEPIGAPVNVLIKMTDDILPDPGAILVTGITPQQTIADGISEAEFLKLFHEEVAIPDTIFVGYNTVRFDDEFMRYLHYRNFYDPYEWQWQDGRSRWDLLDVVRMTRALRPEGIEWPFAPDGKPSNRLELLTAVNKLEHVGAHDALSDVRATIALAKLIRSKQPKLFDFLLTLRDKKKVTELVKAGGPFTYTSGKYPSEFEKTTVVTVLADHPKRQGVLVYDLRYDPTLFAKMSVSELASAWQWQEDETSPRLPIKTLQFNRCPAVAPLSVLDETSQERLNIDIKTINENQKKLAEIKDWPAKILAALEILDKKQQASFIVDEQDVDSQLYNRFFDDQDRQRLGAVRAAGPGELSALHLQFHDQRLIALLPLYKARNFPTKLTDEERQAWEEYRMHKLIAGGASSRAAKFGIKLQTIVEQGHPTKREKDLLEDLQLYAESIIPVAGE